MEISRCLCGVCPYYIVGGLSVGVIRVVLLCIKCENLCVVCVQCSLCEVKQERRAKYSISQMKSSTPSLCLGKVNFDH